MKTSVTVIALAHQRRLRVDDALFGVVFLPGLDAAGGHNNPTYLPYAIAPTGSSSAIS
jgi:hypothetical protein